MKAFLFRPQRILNYRKHLEKKALGELNRARGEHLQVQESVKNMAAKKRAAALECSREARDGMTASRYRLYGGFLQKVAGEIESGQDALKQAEMKVRGRESALKKETVRKKTLEKLKDIQFDKYLAEEQRREQKELDELIVSRKGAAS